MYTKYFGLREKPFTLVPNPNYLYFSSKHRNALTFLEYGLAEKVGFVMLTGEIGIGKTTLVRHLLNQVETEMDVAVIFNTNLVSNDLIKLILNEFEVEFDDRIGKVKALDILYNFLIKRYAAGKKVLLIIDEAQNLSDDALEEIRMLSNLQTDDELLLQIMIVGQPNLRDKIQDPRLEQFAQRISVSYHLAAMSLDDTIKYIGHRLEKAGGVSGLFPEDVIKKIHEISGGIPRTINLLCDAALVYGYADEVHVISNGIIDQVIEDKGGIGVFTRQKLKHQTAQKSDEERYTRLENRISELESQIEKMTRFQNNQLELAKRQAELYQKKMVSNLKTLLEQERKRSATLEYEFGKYRGRHDFASRIKRIK